LVCDPRGDIVLQTHADAQTHSGATNIFRRPSRLFFVLGLFTLVLAAYLAFPRQKPCTDCVILIGDSITSRWSGLVQHNPLSGLQIINRGAPGDSTAHMFSRFDRDVVQLHPRVVVILGGINDIKQIPLPLIEHNLASMAETAEHHGIHVVLATLPPTGLPTEEHDPEKPSAATISHDEIVAHDGITSGHDEIFGHDKIQALNNWIKSFANQKRYTLVDYHSTLTDDRGNYLKGLTSDGIHPSARGYERMEPLLREAIQSATRTCR
jgi:lysophospholipase L1-like esterase